MNEDINPIESPSGDTDTPPPPAMRDGWHPSDDNLTATLYRDGQPVIIAQDMASIAYRLDVTEAQSARLQDSNNALLNKQIMGDDYRLTDFWEKAQELADRAGHCEVFDEIAEALGGPSREREYQVSFSFSYSTTVTARNEDSAIELAQEEVSNLSIDDLYEDNVEAEEA